MVKAGKPCKATCKWCEMGECWNSGQIAKPADSPKPKKSVKKTLPVVVKGKGKGKIVKGKGKGKVVKAVKGKGNSRNAPRPKAEAGRRDRPAKKARAAGLECKWCDEGECWDHGQIEKPAEVIEKEKRQDAKRKLKAKGKGRGKGAINISRAKAFIKNVGGKGGKGRFGKGASGKGRFPKQIAVPVVKKGGGKGKFPVYMMASAGRWGGKMMASAGQPISPKSELHAGIALLLGRDFRKEDCIYETDEEGGKFTATARVPELDREAKYKGAPSAKEAEVGAAKKVFNMLKKQITAAKKERAEAKKEKYKEKKEALKAKKEAE